MQLVVQYLTKTAIKLRSAGDNTHSRFNTHCNLSGVSFVSDLICPLSYEPVCVCVYFTMCMSLCVSADPCYGLNCSGRGQQCVEGRCVCRQQECPTSYDPVCGTDSVTYPNQCTLDLIACTEQHDVNTLHRGVCHDDFMGSGFEGLSSLT